jgi:CoA:oxalate CoA-transferase
VKEVLGDAHLRARGFLTEVDTDAGPVALPNSPMRYDGSSLRALTPAPALGEHTDAVLRELCHLDDVALAELRREGVIGAADER